MSSFKFKVDTIFICEEYVEKKKKENPTVFFFLPYICRLVLGLQFLFLFRGLFSIFYDWHAISNFHKAELDCLRELFSIFQNHAESKKQ